MLYNIWSVLTGGCCVRELSDNVEEVKRGKRWAHSAVLGTQSAHIFIVMQISGKEYNKKRIENLDLNRKQWAIFLGIE